MLSLLSLSHVFSAIIFTTFTGNCDSYRAIRLLLLFLVVFFQFSSLFDIFSETCSIVSATIQSSLPFSSNFFSSLYSAPKISIDLNFFFHLFFLYSFICLFLFYFSITSSFYQLTTYFSCGANDYDLAFTPMFSLPLNVDLAIPLL